MEWNWCWNGNDVTPFLLYESSGDSEEVKSDVHHHHHHHEDHDRVMDGYDKSILMSRFNDDDDNDVDDDAQSCSYDHSSYNINTSYDTNNYHDHNQSQRLTYGDGYDGYDDDDDHHHHHSYIHDDDDDNKNMNWAESKFMMDSCKQQKISHKSCGDSSNQIEIDRKFWETCLAS